MTASDFRRDGFLLGGFEAKSKEPAERRFIQSGDAQLPYTDRKLQRPDDAPLDIVTIVAIQRMACEGKRSDEIYRALQNRGVTLEQIWRLLDPGDEGNKPQQHERAAVGYAGFKRR